MTCQICLADMAIMVTPTIRIAQCSCCGATETLGRFAETERLHYTDALRRNEMTRTTNQDQDNDERQAS